MSRAVTETICDDPKRLGDEVDLLQEGGADALVAEVLLRAKDGILEVLMLEEARVSCLPSRARRERSAGRRTRRS